MDDGERVNETTKVIGNAFVTTLNELDLGGLLTPTSRIKDLCLVMAMMVIWSVDIEDVGIDGDEIGWRKTVVGYAKRAGIDLAAAPPYRTKQRLERLARAEGDIDALEGAAKPDRFGWTKAVSDGSCIDGHGNVSALPRAPRTTAPFLRSMVVAALH